MTALGSELLLEQAHFDKSWEARERKRRSLRDAPTAAAGPRAAAAQIRRSAEKMLETIAGPDEPVAFGRFDLSDGEVIYLGKHLITDDSRDHLVINWQAPFAAPYFTATYDDPRGLARRRKFQTTRNKVDDFEEVVFEDLAKRVVELDGLARNGIDDTVLRDLDEDRTGEMRDIVQTIHSSQYRLIQAPLEQLLIIQGGPGTGKTAVALHRVSWLLFNHRGRLLPQNILVVGPNPTFTRYIRSVLPGLGDADVAHRDLGSLGPGIEPSRGEVHAVARVKGDARMADLLDAALLQRIRVPDRVDEVVVGTETGGARFSRAELEPVLSRYSSSGTYASGRTAFRTWLGEAAGRRTAATITPTQVESAVERLWPSLSPQAFLQDLLSSRERLLAAAGEAFTAGEVNRLLRTAADRLSDETWTDADIALLDEADSLINGPGPRFVHVVVDEAQDLTPMQLRSIHRRSQDGSLTLVGDLAQSTGPWARDSWDDVSAALEKAHPIVMEELGYGYRVPQQVFELAARLLPEAAPEVSPPRVVRQGPADPQLEQVDPDDRVLRAVRIAQERAGQGLFVGIVCPDPFRDELTRILGNRGVHFSDASRGGIGKSINVVSPVEAKGLEFDCVVVIEPEAIVTGCERGLRMLYVALTRTTRYLAVIYSGRLLPLSDASSVSGTVPGVPANSLETVAAGADTEGEAVAPTSVDESVSACDGVVAVDVPLDEPSEPQPTVPKLGSTATAAPDLAALVIGPVATALAQMVRESVPPNLWPRLLEQMRAELGN